MPLVWTGAFVIVLIISLVFFLISSGSKVRRVLFFPNISNHELSGEVRYVPRQRGREGEIGMFVKEQFLGPTDIHHANLVPRNTTLTTILVRGNTLYLDISSDMILSSREVPLSFSEIMSTLRFAIAYNFHGLKDIIITIDGQQFRGHMK